MREVELEASLLKALMVRENLEAYYEVINRDLLLETTKVVLDGFFAYMACNKLDKVDLQGYYTFFTTVVKPNLSQFDRDYYLNDVIPAIQNSEDLECEHILESLRKQKLRKDLLELLESDFDSHNLEDKVSEYNSKSLKPTSQIYVDVDTIDLNQLDKSEGIEWFLPTLQENLYSLSIGQFVGVAAPFGAGKSAFIISQVAHTIKQGFKKVLYFNSEGTESDVMARVWSNLYSGECIAGFEGIVDEKIKYREIHKNEYPYKPLKLYQIANLNGFDHIKHIVLKEKPDLVVLDICDSIAPNEDPGSLKKLYDQCRLLSSVTCPIIGTSQTKEPNFSDKDEDEQQRWLPGNKLYGSITGKGGAFDTLITIGLGSKFDKKRFVSVEKKKRGKMARVICELVEEYSLYREIGW